MAKGKKIPTIVLDCDDTIVDFIGFLCYLFNSKHHSYITEADLKTWNFTNVEVKGACGNTAKGEALRDFFKEYEPHGLYAAIPSIKPSVLAMELMKRLGYKIILLTARGEEFRKDTEINFYVNKIPYDEIIFKAEKDKQINRLARKHNIVVFADDKFDHVKDVHETDKVEACYLITRSHNKSQELPEGVVRVTDLLEVVRTLPDVNSKESLYDEKTSS